MINDILKKVDSTNIKGIRNVDEIERPFEKIACEVMDNIKALPSLPEELLKTYNRNRMWFAYELSVYVGQFLDEVKNEEASKYYTRLQKVRNMNLVPSKKENIMSNLKSFFQLSLKDEKLMNAVTSEKWQ